MKQIHGIMWEIDHERDLTIEEYKYWMKNTLPFGWSIISEPVEIKETIVIKIEGVVNNGNRTQKDCIGDT